MKEQSETMTPEERAQYLLDYMKSYVELPLTAREDLAVKIADTIREAVATCDDDLEIWDTSDILPALPTLSHEDIARMMDAAPELYEALKMLCDVQNGPPLLRDSNDWERAMDAARAALAKAKDWS